MTNISPARKQYLEIKQQFPDAILFYQVGECQETFDDDAYIAARELQIVRTVRTYGKERVPLAGIPIHALDNYVGKLVQRGYKIVICNQTGEVIKGRDVVERAVARILTAGTLSEPNLLPVRQNNYLVAIAHGRAQTALAAVDVSTGEFMVTWFAFEELPVALDAELQRLHPAECLLIEGVSKEAHQAYQFPSKTVTITYCPAYFFQYETAQTRLCRQFGVQSLEAYGCAAQPQAVVAAGAIVAYLEKVRNPMPKGRGMIDRRRCGSSPTRPDSVQKWTTLPAKLGTSGCVASPLLYGATLNICTRVKEVCCTLNRWLRLSRHTSPGKPERLKGQTLEPSFGSRYQPTTAESGSSGTGTRMLQVACSW